MTTYAAMDLQKGEQKFIDSGGANDTVTVQVRSFLKKL